MQHKLLTTHKFYWRHDAQFDCWANSVLSSRSGLLCQARQPTLGATLQASEGPLQGWQTWDSSSGNVQSLQWQYAKPDLIWLHSLTSGEQKHVFFSGLSSISSHISSHVYYKWKSIFPACAGTYLREQSYQKTFWYFSVFPGEWMAHEQNMVVKTRLQKRFYLKSCSFLIQWRLNSLKNSICDWSLLTYTHTQIYSNRFIYFFLPFLVCFCNG